MIRLKFSCDKAVWPIFFSVYICTDDTVIQLYNIVMTKHVFDLKTIVKPKGNIKLLIIIFFHLLYIIRASA